MHRLSSALFPLTCTPGQVMKWNGSAWSCAADATVGGTPANVFVQGGNAFSADGVLGTIDANRALDVVAGGGRVMRWEPNATSPNVIGGNPANAVAPGVRGAAIAGGGATTEPNFAFPAPNVVTDAYGTVAGGYGNRAGDGTGSVLMPPLRRSGVAWAMRQRASPARSAEVCATLPRGGRAL